MDNNFLENIYQLKFGTSNDINSLGWGSTFSQQKRFDVLLEIGYRQDNTLLDVGCGYGDLSSRVVLYTGIDARKSAIDIAKSKYNSEFLNTSIHEIDRMYDWVVASGIFCFEKDWNNNTSETIKKMWNISTKGVSVNFLSELGSKREKDMKYCSISEVISIISEITNKFIVRHDYLPNDFTLYLYK